MAILQSIPGGFLSLLGIKSGSNPGQSAEYVQPTLELSTLYLASAIQGQFNAVPAATNTGDSAFVVIPPGEAWRLYGMDWTADTAGAPATIAVALRVQEPVTQIALFQNIPIMTVITAGNLHGSGILFPQPTVFPPGTVLSATLLNDLGALTINLGMHIIFQKLVV